jgi:hypothetical protein
VGNASVDDTNVAVAVTFFFTTDGKLFVLTFNCSIHNTSKCQMSRLLVQLCLQASFFIGRTRLSRRVLNMGGSGEGEGSSIDNDVAS